MISWAQGYKGDDILYVNQDTICHICGSTVKFIDIKNGTDIAFQGEGNGVKTLAANPYMQVFAIAEHGLKPKIYVHSYPSFEVISCLEGAKLEYSKLAFSHSKKLLAACTGLPDFSIFLWNWDKGELTCSQKLLSEEPITSLLFNPLNQCQLSLIGPNQATVWSIENCNDISSLKSTNVALPTTDGVLVPSDDRPPSRSVTRLGYSLHIPSVIKAGLFGEEADSFEPPDAQRPRVEPTAQCWSSRGEVFVGCKGGQLFRIDGDSGEATLVLGGISDRILSGEMKEGMFTCMAYNAKGIVAGGIDCNIRSITINNNGINIQRLWMSNQAPSALIFNPKTYAELLYGTRQGVIYKYDLLEGESTMISECHTGRFVGVEYGGSSGFCLTCREYGDIQVWNSKNGELIGGLPLNDKVSSMAYCPSCPLLVVGSSSGLLRFVDTTSLHGIELDLRQVYSQRIHHGPVSFLKFDSFGIFLLSASKDENQIFVFNVKPSAKFQCVGFIDCGGAIKDLSIYTQDEKCHVAAVVAPPEKKSSGQFNELVVFTLTPGLLDGDDSRFASTRKNFRDDVIGLSHHYLSASVDSAVITGISEVVEIGALSRLTKKLLKFNLPRDQGEDDDQAELITPVSEHKGHQLGGGFLVLSPHRGWLASSSKDGNILVRDLKDWDSCVSVFAHSFMDSGTKCFAFAPDSKCLLSIGAGDDSLSCFEWHFSEKGNIQASLAVEFSRVLNMRLRNTMEAESEVLFEMVDWNTLSQASGNDPVVSDPDPSSTTSDSEKNDKEVSAEDSNTVDGASPLPSSNLTWLDEREAEALQQDNSKYDVEKQQLRNQIDELRQTILHMIDKNQNLPELERLKREEYNLDIEEQKRMQAQQDKEVQEVRDDINMENLAQRYLAYLIKKECWDNMETKGRALRTFSHQVTVSNYPTIAVTPDEEELLQRVTKMRKVEVAENAVRKAIVDAAASKTSAVGEEEEEEEDEQTVSLALHGSLGPNYNGDSDLYYSQFELHTREQKMAQTVLLKNAIRRIKNSFNESFDNVLRSKEQEIARIKERNVRIRKIMEELNMGPVCVADPELDENEMPEKSFEVKDSEITVERVLSEEQQREKEKEDRLEEERKAASKGDNKRERALMDMMGGVLEVKKEDILKQDLSVPDFAEERAEKDWTDEEKKKYKDYEKRLKELQEEREKYRKNLENELKKLQQANTDGMTAFDETLNALFNKKVKVEMVINQEELKILRLTVSLITDDELSTHEARLNYLLELRSTLQTEAAVIETEIGKKVEDYREFYDGVVAEDKMLDRGFKRDFSDIPLSLSDQLYKLFKRRPRVQRHQKNVDESASFDPFGLFDKVVDTSPQGGDSAAATQAFADLDAPSSMPEGLDETLWQRLCESRRVKYESELRVKQTAMTLAEMTQYLQYRQDELDRLNRKIDDVIKQQTKLYEDVMKNDLNLEVQLLLKQGQVEVPCGKFIPDYSDSILIHRGVVEDLNGTIRTLGEGKVAAMTESKDFKKGIHQLEWERKKMSMLMVDLNNKARHIQMLKLTKEIQAFLNEENHSAKQAKEISVLEQTLLLLDRQLERQIQHKEEAAAMIHRRLRAKQEENKELDKVLEELHVAVSERHNISEVNAIERAKNTADKRLQGIVQRRKLVDLAKAQAQEVAVLRAEVERLRMKTFPALVQVER